MAGQRRNSHTPARKAHKLRTCAVASDTAVAEKGEAAEPKAKSLRDADDRPVGEADLTNEDALETAMYYLKKRQQIEDEIFSTEQEWIRLFSVAGDLGAAMEYGQQKEELEAQLEEMREKEREIAEEMVVVRDLEKEVRAKRAQLGRLKDEQAELGSGSKKLMDDLEELKGQATDCEADIRKLQRDELHARTEIDKSRENAAKLKSEAARARGVLEKLEPEVVAARAEEEERGAEKAKLTKALTDLKSELSKLEAGRFQEELQMSAAKQEQEQLEEAKVKVNERLAEFEIELPHVQAALENLPKEIDATSAKAEELEAQIASLKAQLGPEGEKLETVTLAAKAAEEEVSELRSKRLQAQQEADDATAAMYSLVKEKRSLEGDIARLQEEEEAAIRERDELSKLVPKILVQRNRMLDKVSSTVEEGRLTREELLDRAKETRMRLEESALDKALAEEEQALQDVALEVSSVAKSASDNVRNAQAAFDAALQMREAAERDFVSLRDAMDQRLEIMQAQQDALAASMYRQSQFDSEVQALIESTAAQSKRFHTANRALNRFNKNIETLEGQHLRVKSHAAGEGEGKNSPVAHSESSDAEEFDVVKGAVGILAQMLKSTATSAQEAARAAKAQSETERSR